MPDPAPRSREQPLAFASFRLLRDQKILLQNQLPVRIGSRALELLIALVERAGEVVGKNELIACVWPDTVVEENNLRVHISAIRKLLGDGDSAKFILNVAGRGYSFVAPVTREAAVPGFRPQASECAALPVALTRVVGRDVIVGTVVAVLETSRLVTLFGPGGIGKTTVSLAVADQLAGDSRFRLCFVDLAVVADPDLVAAAIAAAVGSEVPLDDPLAALCAYVQPLQLLLIIDNCEHLVGCVAAIVEKLLHAAPGLKILATSRERLQAEGEQAVPLGPLACPDPVARLTADEAMRYPAIELFVERALGVHDAFALSDQNAATIAAICRRLDGLPLAIELVAARTSALGLDVLLQSIDQNLMLVSSGRRNAAGRHQSLSATLDWSFRLLPATEQIVLLRVSRFSALFSAQAAIAVAAGDGVSPHEVANALMSLVQRSLLVADTGAAIVRYRLLYVTRAFASARLAQTDEANAVYRRHAEHHCTVLERASLEWDTLSRVEWLARHGAELADLRSALQWAFGPQGDAAVGARLFVAALPLGAQLSLQEFEPRAMLTLEVLRAHAVPDVIAELRVRTALAVLLLQSGAREDVLRLEIERMVALAQQAGAPKLMTEALSAHAIMALEAADYVVAVQRFEVLQAIAKQADDASAVLTADRLGAQVFHWAGDQQKARARAERVLRHPASSIALVYGQAPVDRQISMRIILARVAWLEGRADEAREIAASAAQLAVADAPIDLCQALGFAACPIALWRGDRDEAQALIGRLLEHSRRYNFMRWTRLASCYQECLNGSDAGGVNTPVSALQQDLLTTISMRWVNADTLHRAEAGAAGWCNAELLRVVGERCRREARPDAAAMAELRFRTALGYARGQGALAWELRIATSLARLRATEGHRVEARETLESVCARFTQGQHTADYRTALSVLAGL